MSSLRYFDEIRYGNFEGLTVLVDPKDNSLFVTQPTIEKILSYPENTARKKVRAKKLKDFAGKPLSAVRSVKATDSWGRPNTTTAIPFDVFLELVYWEAFKGSGIHQEKAQALLKAGFADSFSSLVLEQCGIKLTQEERQHTISFYLEGYHKFQDWVRDTHIAVHGIPPTSEYYRQMAISINQHLFGRNHFKCDRLNNCGVPELRTLENFQIAFMQKRLAKKKDDPAKIMAEYLQRLDC